MSPNASSVTQTNLPFTFVPTQCRECGSAFVDELLLRRQTYTPAPEDKLHLAVICRVCSVSAALEAGAAFQVDCVGLGAANCNSS